MDGKGRALDNIFVERLWPVRRCGTVKYENIYLKAYVDGWQLESGLEAYFDFYNQRRFHQGLGYQTPVEVLKGEKTSRLNQVENKINGKFVGMFLYKSEYLPSPLEKMPYDGPCPSFLIYHVPSEPL